MSYLPQRPYNFEFNIGTNERITAATAEIVRLSVSSLRIVGNKLFLTYRLFEDSELSYNVLFRFLKKGFINETAQIVFLTSKGEEAYKQPILIENIETTLELDYCSEKAVTTYDVVITYTQK